jgi:hypothetical protein
MDEVNLKKKVFKNLDREEELKVLNNSDDYLRKRDYETSKLKVDAKEARVKINKTNDDTIRRHLRYDKFMKVLNHRNGNQYDTFVDLLIKKE